MNEAPELPIPGVDPEPCVDDGRDVSLLAAAHAALEPARREARLDILGESVLRVLASCGPASTGRIRTELNKLWRTTSISDVLVRSALENAQGARLVVKQQHLFGASEWTLAEQARRDLVEDEQWARRVVTQFDDEATHHLDDDPDRVLIRDDRLATIIARVREALAIGAEGLYSLTPAATTGALRPVRFNDREAFASLGDLQPISARRAAERLLLATLNPDDPFGDEYLNLLAAGNILHGLVTRRDLQTQPRLAGARIALDTSVIVGLAHPGSELAQGVEEAIRISREVGVEVVVADHSLAEWDRLFEAANQDMEKSGTGQPGLGAFAPLVQNPFVGAFLALADDNPTLTWSDYGRGMRDPRRALEKLGVAVRPHGNNLEDDRGLVEDMRRELRRMNRDRATDDGPRRRLRTVDAIDADAESAAMVARWRGKGAGDRAFFVARDRMTGLAYRHVRSSDQVPLVVTMPAWLLLVASLLGDDPTRSTEVARIVGNAAIRDSFLALAACYTYEEVIELADALSSDHEPIGPEDVAEFVQAVLDGFEDEASRSDRLAEVRLRGAQLLSDRAARRNQRARRATVLVDDTVDREVSKARDEATVALAADRIRAEQDAKGLRDQLAISNASAAKWKLKSQRWKRLVVLLPTMIALLVGVVVLWHRGSLDGGLRKPAIVLAYVLAWIPAGAFIREGAKKALAIAVGILLVPFAVNVLSNLFSR